ncbi:helix-turn-helix domain-containing protein [Amycolatopsis sp. cmx-11-12]|uniref:nSTAND1 domain-containing NTPase n=1 Tax=Amycolatopsis sp. cmx-11-12 TaxID=2785795 RepID=UPI0039183485
MPRPERPLDPDADPIQRFAFELRKLRQQVGSPSYRVLARLAHYSPATLADAAGGRRLPSLAVTLAYVRVCDGDEQAWEARWRHTAAEAEGIPATPDNHRVAEPAPYLGLARFEQSDATKYFGREHLVGELLAAVDQQRFVAVIGASGSGKSSLLRAGLLPNLDCETLLITPSEHLADERRLTDALTSHGDREFVLVVDQFEEIFTLCQDGARRQAFIATLLAATKEPNNRARVVLGLRADFYGHCARHPELVPVLRNGQVLVATMTTDELRAMITQPAHRTGNTIEGALVSRLIGETSGQACVLPLVSHALLETWHRRRGNALTLAGYVASGGIASAVANSAEQVYAALQPSQQRRAKDIVLRLTALGEGTEDTKRRIARTELDDDPDTAIVLHAFAQARLLTLGEDSVEIAHEALIKAWPRLGDWLAADRDGLRVRRQLTEATDIWESHDHDPGALYRGVRLAAAREWIGRGKAVLTVRESAFLEASTAAQARSRNTAKRHARQFRWLAASLAVLLAAAVGISIVAVADSEVATSRQLAAEAQNEAGRDVAKAIRLGLDAYRTHPTTEARSVLLSLASRRDYQARLVPPAGNVPDAALSSDGRWLAAGGEPGKVVLWDVASRSRSVELSGQFSLALTATFSRDGQRLAVGTDRGELLIWNIPSRTLLVRGTEPGLIFTNLAFSPDGRSLASITGKNLETSFFRLWDPLTATPVTTLDTHQGFYAKIAFAPDGGTLATTEPNGQITLWEMASRSPRAALPGGAGPATAVAFSADGRLIATATSAHTIQLWNAETRVLQAELPGHRAEVTSLAFVPEGGRLYSSDADGTLLVWDAVKHARIGQLRTGKPAWLSLGGISPNGQLVVGIDGWSSFLVWDRTQLPFLGHTGAVTGAAYAPDGRTLLSGGTDGTLLAWDIQQGAIATAVPNAVSSTALSPGPVFSPDGKLFTTVSGSAEVSVWETSSLRKVITLSGHASSVRKAIFSPDGKTLTVADNSQSLVRWNTATWQRTDVPLGEVTAVDINYSPTGRLFVVATHFGAIQFRDSASHILLSTMDTHAGLISAVAFSPDGNTVATAAQNGTITFWDTTDPARPRHLSDISSYTSLIHTMAYSPDGKKLAIASGDETVALWDTGDRSRWATLTGHTEPVTSLAWNADGTTLASGSKDHSITPWTIDTEAATRKLCDVLAHNFPGTQPAPQICAE